MTISRRQFCGALGAGVAVANANLFADEVVKEAPVKFQVGESGTGKADYVLEDDNGKPLGVVEAKKTAVDPQLGRKQAEQYADGLEKEHGQRPVIFYTNGYDQWIWNDAAGEPPRKIYGFYSKDSLQHLHFQRTAKKPVGEVAANPHIAGRMYQIEAVRRVVEQFADMRDDVVNLVSSLRINLSQVKLKLPVIERVKSDEFWEEVTVAGLEEIRDQLRGVVQFRRKDDAPKFAPFIIDIKEDEADVERKKHKVRLDRLDDLDMVAYRNRVNNVLQAIIDQNETLRKIGLGQPVTEHDLEDLCSLVLTQEPGLDLHNLMDYFTQAESLDQAIRAIIGMDADVVQQRFTKFVQAHPNLASHQIKFLDLLQNHIAKFGSIKTDDLYEAPFTTLHSDSLDGLFEESLADEIFEIIGSFQTEGDQG